ncbi:hypothetical protein A0H81_04255 [Grifola frondosa]|uniref:Uncharacterized protein n=1 Tax=Grifola frondosa TaxID=5627 RepID=A0A1C7MG86_GRIFR|nr:hypothetical protein A0H81_04255 [Grifola frondosa]
MSVGFVGVIVGIVCTVFTRKPNEDAIPHLYNVPICQLSLSVQQVYYLLGSYIVLLLADATVFLLTVVKVAQIRQHFPEGLFEIMLRDGIIYFGILVVLNISNICTLLLADPPEKVISLTATNVMSSTLIARWILNLRDPNLHGSPSQSSTDRYSSRTIAFQQEQSRDGTQS